ncbi:epoxide hydrolase family protein [Mesorhizobium qingshengii]|uniref:Pimeloyl-ACP methyl ester carboxylesterase n=1 Tax=Mesorhizobium qingshengii TaxID=1165689 RepID=A0A1G5Z824_9HYPH|nr:epoxide hydrolase family protein [Mesorhizobium qingshengii]SDA91179.1 Pimeloyl-ACP methyl ester carboxylesterase [Mesorhizobium qingshengii]
MEIRPFTIHVAQTDIDELQRRIANWREPDQLPGIGWAQGTEHEELRRVVQHWRTGFDWRSHEASWNTHPHYRTDIGGETIHFIHARAAIPTDKTIILTHGWPGSFLEFGRLLPLLRDPASHGGKEEDAFNVVIPSIPGYGFSSRPSKPGLNLFAIANLWAELMNRLGYDRYLAQGGDLGASVATCLAHADARHVAGVHLNFIPGTFSPPHDASPAGDLTAEERAFLQLKAKWADLHGAYGHIQATRPQTLAYGLTDSPVGLAAWMIEKFREWSDCGGNLSSATFSQDDMLANISLYWFTRTIASSMRLYWETRARPLAFPPGTAIDVPLALALFPKELPMPPRSWVERVFRDVRRWTAMPRGGHFAALEEPLLMANDLRAFARDLEFSC